MAKWTISEYTSLPLDVGGNVLPIFSHPRATVGKTAGATITLNGGTRYVRLCGDTAAHVAFGASASTDDAYVPAGSEFLIGVDARNDTQLTFIAG